ncbi:MAG: hypothetical protein Kow0025_18950 [Thermodesulfovibrionales bacterium]
MTPRVLLFNEDERELRRLGGLFRNGDFTVIESARVLEALRLLKTEDISLVISSHDPSGVEAAEFRQLAESARPGVRVFFVGRLADSRLSVDPGELRRFVQASITSSASLGGEVDSLRGFCFSFVERLLQIFDVNDWYFFRNDKVVSELSGKTALKMGLPRDQVEAVRMAALLKDLGMIGIQRQILGERRRFSTEELTPFKKHPLNTAELFRSLQFPWDVDSMISQHHERYDGKGYPQGLRGREISLGARIIAIADSYVAMTSNRPYRNALPREDALKEIVSKAGSQFDPEVVEAFLAVVREEPERQARRSVLVLERQPALSALIRLGISAESFAVMTGASSFDAIRLSRQSPPDIVVADVEMLDRDAFMGFYNALQEIPPLRGVPFIFVVPAGHPRTFKRERALYLEKPVDMGELARAIDKALGEEKPEAPAAGKVSGLTGSLEDFSLGDLFQILSLGRKTARVEISGEGRKGTVFIENGSVVHASTSGLSGKEAFFELMQWESGAFRIVHGETTRDKNIRMDTMHLLLETISLLDEKRKKDGPGA